jgi:hypothetical protein
MKRVICLLMAVGISTPVIAAASAQTPPPPGPSSDWAQGDLNGAPPMRNGRMQFGGPMRDPQSMPGFAEAQQRMQDMQSRFQQMQAQAQANKETGIRWMLDVNDARWMQIKPRLDRIDRLKAEVNASLDLGGSFSGSSNFATTTTPEGGATSGGWAGGGFTMSAQGGPNGTRVQSWSSAPSGGSGDATKTGSLCRELSNLLQAANVPPAQVSQKIAALRQSREQAQRELTRERKELRALVNFRQEAALIAMGYLD